MSKILIEKIDFCKQCPYFGPAFPSGNACERVSRSIAEPESLPNWCPLPESGNAPLGFQRQREQFVRDLADEVLKHLASNP